MRRPVVVFLLGTLVLTACGGGGGDDDGTPPKALQFEQVMSVTEEYFRAGGEDRGRGEKTATDCERPDWNAPGLARERQLVTSETEAERVEVLRCPPFDSLNRALYLEFEDAGKARDRVGRLYGECSGRRCAPYLLAGDTAVVLPAGVGGPSDMGTDYLEALKADCACGEISRPAPQR